MTPSEHTDTVWIEQYRKGNVSALDHLVEHYRRPLYAFIYNMMQGNGDAEEIFQEVWLRAIRNLKNYHDRNFAGWLFRIARNLFIDGIRRESKFVRPPGDADPDSESASIERFPSKEASPDRLVAAKDLGQRIRESLAQLPADQREVFLMRTEADLSFKEIATIQGTTLNTALSRMHYALQRLRPLLQEEYESFAGGTNHE